MYRGRLRNPRHAPQDSKTARTQQRSVLAASVPCGAHALGGTCDVTRQPTSGARLDGCRYEEHFTTASFSPDSSRILTAGACGGGAELEHRLALWDAKTGRMQAALRGHTAAIATCRFSADGAAVVSASEDYTLRLWDSESGAWRATLTGHTGAVAACAFAPQRSDRVLSASADSTLRIWEAAASSWACPVVCKQTLKGHAGPVAACEWLGPRTIVSCSADGTARWWCAADVKEEAEAEARFLSMATFHSRAQLQRLTLGPIDGVVAVGAADGAVTILTYDRQEEHLPPLLPLQDDNAAVAAGQEGAAGPQQEGKKPGAPATARSFNRRRQKKGGACCARS